MKICFLFLFDHDFSLFVCDAEGQTQGLLHSRHSTTELHPYFINFIYLSVPTLDSQNSLVIAHILWTPSYLFF
jgi:hypothetical protein